MPVIIAFSGILLIAMLVLITSYICFRRVFYFKNPGPVKDGEFDYPVGKVYEPYREEMKDWQIRLGEIPYRSFEIRSFDGLKLCARYYECMPGAPIELMFHGYQGNSIRDLSGGVFRAFKLCHNVLLIDHRAAGASEGSIITFGINEHRDCLMWIDVAKKTFGEDVRLILTGVSMGAATVMTASGCDLPENVRYILADCGYSTAKDIIKKVIHEMKLPENILYPFVKLGARIFGKFDLEETSPLEGVKNSKTPILFIHGDNDDYVPCEMSRELYEACASEKKFVVSPGAGHGLAYSENKELYLSALCEFDEKYC